MIPRVTQLMARLIAAGLAATAGALGAGEQEAAGLVAHADAIAAALGAVLMGLIDLLIHRSGLGAIMAPAKSAAIVVVVACFGLAVGCAGVPVDLVRGHLDTAGADHQARLLADDSLAAVELAVWGEHYAAMREAVDAAKGGQ